MGLALARGKLPANQRRIRSTALSQEDTVTRSRTWDKTALRITATAAVLLAVRPAEARPSRAASNQIARTFGLGLMVGAPTGLSAKYYLDDRMAVAGGLGVFRELRDHEGEHLHVDVLWHPAVLANTDALTLPFYAGVGGRLLRHRWSYYWDGDPRYGYEDTHLGLRLPVGLLMNFKRSPLDVFFELALVFDFVTGSNNGRCYDAVGRTFYCGWDHDAADLNGAIGARYYF
jgi:hypothetical protein